MTKTINNIRLLLCTFSGEDNFIIKKCTGTIQITFATIGAFVITIFIGCFTSAYSFFNSLLENNYYISLPIGIVWALLVTNMYLLLLYTVAPTTLPVKEKKTVQNTFFSLSMFFRISFISLLAVIIAQPLNVYFLSTSVDSSIRKHIQEEKTNMVIVADKFLIKNELELFTDFNEKINLTCSITEKKELYNILAPITKKIKTDDLFIKKSTLLINQIHTLKEKVWLDNKERKKKDSLINTLELLTNKVIESDKAFVNKIEGIKIYNNNNNLSKDFEVYKSKLIYAINQKIDNYNKLEYLLSKSNFYIKRIQLLLFENPNSWLITAIVCFLFILPIYFKYKVREKTDFYNWKIKIEKKIIKEEYSGFKKEYSQLLNQNTKRYNSYSQSNLIEILDLLKKANQDSYQSFLKEIKDEYKDEIMSKYEYWEDSPFRTIKPKTNIVKNEEATFLDFLYNENQ